MTLVLSRLCLYVENKKQQYEQNTLLFNLSKKNRKYLFKQMDKFSIKMK